MPLILCTFPVTLAIIMLLLQYKPKDLGIRLQGILVSAPIILIIASVTWLIAPQNIKWYEMITEGGIIGTLFTGFIVAALSEEFWRFIAQTRLAVPFNNKDLAWFVATMGLYACSQMLWRER